MYLVALAWLYVALLMAVAEATSPIGTVLGAIITFVLYGLMPIALVMYLLGTPGRRRVRRMREAAAEEASFVGAPDTGGQAPTAPKPGSVAPVREKK